MHTNKNSIRNKLIARGRIVLFLILLMIVASQLVIGILKNTSNELVIEYNEMMSIQEFKLSLHHLLLQTNKSNFFENEDAKEFLHVLLHQAHEKFDVARQTLTDSHNSIILNNFLPKLQNLDSLVVTLNENENTRSEKYREQVLEINAEIYSALRQIDLILAESKLETNQIVETNKAAFRHSTLTILLLGIFVLLIFIVVGLNFVNKLTKPIDDFVTTTKRIIGGEKNIRVTVDTGDEFSTLANYFNQMLESQVKTTVSKSYLDNILTNMFDSLIVTDNELKIRSINQSALDLLGYKYADLAGKPLGIIFGETDEQEQQLSNEKIKTWQKKITNRKSFMHASGKKIPVLISCALLKSGNDKSNGLIIVGHDLTESVKIERELEQSRKQRQIDINDAQEEERMRIATDLHDGLGQMLTAISYTTHEFQNIDEKDYQAKEKLIIKIQEQIDNAIRESKNIAQNLIPLVLKDFGLVVAIQNLIARANEMYDIRFSFNAFDFNERIDMKLEKSLYRICQESLNNILKHSGAKNANYQIFMQDDRIVLVIDDDGNGFDMENIDTNSSSGIGLVSMRERVQAFEGSLSIDSQLGNGTELIIEVPCRK
ncbi:MAG: PAS domain S-box protein [Bacteroidales bacterium]|nr:PAS domain S-box protein [Bacteroidales bacterium]MCF6342901.1 PAS domain S-box protein [Bacteroidales bacterium]